MGSIEAQAKQAALVVATAPLDVEATRAKNREERDKRLNNKGIFQFREATGELARFAEDHWATGAGDRSPVNEYVDALIVGCGHGGIIAAKSLHDDGFKSIRMIDKASDFGGVWYWNRYAVLTTRRLERRSTSN